MAESAHVDRLGVSSGPALEQAEIEWVVASKASLKIRAHYKSRFVSLAQGRDEVPGAESEALLKLSCLV